MKLVFLLVELTTLGFVIVVPCDGVGICLNSLIVWLLNSIVVVAQQIRGQYRINQGTVHRMLPSICC